jgi:hypothetical protein
MNHSNHPKRIKKNEKKFNCQAPIIVYLEFILLHLILAMLSRMSSRFARSIRYERTVGIIPDDSPLDIGWHARNIFYGGCRNPEFEYQRLDGRPFELMALMELPIGPRLPTHLMEIDEHFKSCRFKVDKFNPNDIEDPEIRCIVETFRDNERYGIVDFVSQRWKYGEKYPTLFAEMALKLFLPENGTTQQVSPYIDNGKLFLARRSIYTAFVLGVQPVELSTIPLSLLEQNGDYEFTTHYEPGAYPEWTPLQRCFMDTFRDNDRFYAVSTLCNLNTVPRLYIFDKPYFRSSPRGAVNCFVEEMRHLFIDPPLSSFDLTLEEWEKKLSSEAI